MRFVVLAFLCAATVIAYVQRTALSVPSKAIEGRRCASDTKVIVTYDEFGGQRDHATPPGQGRQARPGRRDGSQHADPGAGDPSGAASRFVVDHTQYDTISILATIERAQELAPPASRNAAVRDLSSAFRARAPHLEVRPSTASR